VLEQWAKVAQVVTFNREIDLENLFPGRTITTAQAAETILRFREQSASGTQLILATNGPEPTVGFWLERGLLTQMSVAHLVEKDIGERQDGAGDAFAAGAAKVICGLKTTAHDFKKLLHPCNIEQMIRSGHRDAGALLRAKNAPSFGQPCIFQPLRSMSGKPLSEIIRAAGHP
jgi:hypothetical protein